MRITKLALFLLLGTLVGSRMAHAQPSDHGDGRGDHRGDGRGEARMGDREDGAAHDDAGQAGNRYFHQRLSPYGRWQTHARYGEVWRPRVAAGWRPYSTGHWVYTDYGWTWAADEPWGWAPFHYGRWYHDAGLGWGWVPGNVWAPAWVDWRNGGGYVGWAALPPEAGFTVGVGVSFGGFDLNAALVPSYYCFVPERAILEPRLGGFFASPTRNVEIIRGTTNVNGIAVVNNRVFNQGVSVQRIEQVSGRAVPRVQVGSQAAFYRPGVVTTAARQTRSENFVNRPAPRAASAGAARVAQNGRNSVSRSRAQHATSTRATQPPTHRSQPASARSNTPARRVAGANPPQHGTQQRSARSNPPQHGTQQRSARSNLPPPRHVAAAPQHPAHAPARAGQQPPPPSKEQPQVQKQRPPR